MLEEFIKFSDQWDSEKRFNIYNLALNYHNIKKIKQFRNVLFKEAIIKKFKLKNLFIVCDEMVFNEYYQFCYYYKYHSDIDEYNTYLKFIMDTINSQK